MFGLCERYCDNCFQIRSCWVSKNLASSRVWSVGSRQSLPTPAINDFNPWVASHFNASFDCNTTMFQSRRTLALLAVLLTFAPTVVSFLPFQQHRRPSHQTLRVATDPTSTSSTMDAPGVGRIEDAMKAAKDRGEAAFVGFTTAGYPNAEGTCWYERWAYRHRPAEASFSNANVCSFH